MDIFGTRPEAIQMAPVIKEFKKQQGKIDEDVAYWNRLSCRKSDKKNKGFTDVKHQVVGLVFDDVNKHG